MVSLACGHGNSRREVAGIIVEEVIGQVDGILSRAQLRLIDGQGSSGGSDGLTVGISNDTTILRTLVSLHCQCSSSSIGNVGPFTVYQDLPLIGQLITGSDNRELNACAGVSRLICGLRNDHRKSRLYLPDIDRQNSNIREDLVAIGIGDNTAILIVVAVCFTADGQGVGSAANIIIPTIAIVKLPLITGNIAIHSHRELGICAYLSILVAGMCGNCCHNIADGQVSSAGNDLVAVRVGDQAAIPVTVTVGSRLNSQGVGVAAIIIVPAPAVVKLPLIAGHFTACNHGKGCVGALSDHLALIVDNDSSSSIANGQSRGVGNDLHTVGIRDHTTVSETVTMGLCLNSQKAGSTLIGNRCPGGAHEQLPLIACHTAFYHNFKLCVGACRSQHAVGLNLDLNSSSGAYLQNSNIREYLVAIGISDNAAVLIVITVRLRANDQRIGIAAYIVVPAIAIVELPLIAGNITIDLRKELCVRALRSSHAGGMSHNCCHNIADRQISSAGNDLVAVGVGDQATIPITIAVGSRYNSQGIGVAAIIIVPAPAVVKLPLIAGHFTACNHGKGRVGALSDHLALVVNNDLSGSIANGQGRSVGNDLDTVGIRDHTAISETVAVRLCLNSQKACSGFIHNIRPGGAHEELPLVADIFKVFTIYNNFKLSICACRSQHTVGLDLDLNSGGSANCQGSNIRNDLTAISTGNNTAVLIVVTVCRRDNSQRIGVAAGVVAPAFTHVILPLIAGHFTVCHHKELRIGALRSCHAAGLSSNCDGCFCCERGGNHGNDHSQRDQQR